MTQKQAVAAEAPALGDDHAFGAAFGDRNLCGDGVRLVQDVWRRAARHVGNRARIDELGAPGGQAGLWRVPAGQRRVVERQHVVLRRFEVEDVLQLPELVGHGRRQVVVLGGIVHYVVELPLVPGDHVRRLLAAELPRQRHRRRRRNPALVVNRAVAEHLEVLRGMPGRRVGVGLVKRVGQARTFDRQLLDTVDRVGRRDTGRLEDRRHDVDDVVELAANVARVADVAGPRDRHALRRAAEMGRYLLHPFERRVECPGPRRRVVREGTFGAPELVPEELILDRHLDAVEGGELVGRAVDHAFGARAIVAADVDDQGVVELAQVLDGLDDTADLVVGVSLIGRIDIRLLDEQLLFFPTQRIPARQLGAVVDVLSVRPRRQLRVGRHDAQLLLVGKDRFAQLFPAVVEQVQRADLVNPFLGWVVRRVRGAGHVIDEEGLLRRQRLRLSHVLDRLVGHRRLHVPAGIALEGEDRRRVAEQVRLPLAGVAADKAVEVLETHAVRPLPERPGLAVREERRVVILAEPRGRVAVVPQDGADGALLDRDDRVVTGEAGRDLADHAEAHRVVVAPGNQRRARRRAQRGRVEVGVTQPGLGDAVQRRGRDDAAEGAGRAEAVVVGHDQQHVGRLLRRDNAWRPPRGRFRSSLLDHPAELRVGRRQLVAAEGGGGAGRTQLTGDFHGLGNSSRQHRGGGQHSDQKSVYFGFHEFYPHWSSICLGVEDAGQLVRRPVYITKTTLRRDLLRRALQVKHRPAVYSDGHRLCQFSVGKR